MESSPLPSPFCHPRALIGLHGASVSAAQIMAVTLANHARRNTHTETQTHARTLDGELFIYIHLHENIYLYIFFLTASIFPTASIMYFTAFSLGVMSHRLQVDKMIADSFPT